jgi:hypothetical protein
MGFYIWLGRCGKNKVNQCEVRKFIHIKANNSLSITWRVMATKLFMSIVFKKNCMYWCKRSGPVHVKFL